MRREWRTCGVSSYGEAGAKCARSTLSRAFLTLSLETRPARKRFETSSWLEVPLHRQAMISVFLGVLGDLCEGRGDGDEL